MLDAKWRCRVKKAVIILLILFFMFSFLSSAKADVGAIAEGSANVTPVNSTQIALTKENLEINFFYNNAGVDALFYMKNTGDKIDQKMGFPFGGNAGYPSYMAVYVNGEKLAESAITENDSNSEMWKIFTVPFGKNEEKTIRVKYTVQDLFAPTFTYLIKTGSTWKGSIGELNTTITLPDEARPPFFLKAIPSGYSTKGKTIVYHLKNYEPNENILIEFLPLDFYKEMEKLRETAYKTNKPEDWYDYLKELLPLDIVGPYGSRNVHGYFVNEYKTDGYKNFVQSELKKGIDACKDTAYGKILNIAYAAHFDEEDTFISGVLVMKDFSNIENIFKDELENPKTKEVERVVAYYYWWKANALGGMAPKYESFNALAKFIKYAEKYILFDECRGINNVEIVAYSPFFSDCTPIFEEFIYPKEVSVTKDVSDKVRSVRFDFQLPHDALLEQYKRYMQDDAKKISSGISELTFDFESGDSHTFFMTCTVPQDNLALLESKIEKIPQILGTEHSPFYVYPKAFLEDLKENSLLTEFNVKNNRENAILQLEKAEEEIDGNVTDYWRRMEDGMYSNTYKGVIEIPIEYIERNKYFLKEVPDKIPIELIEEKKAFTNKVLFILITLIATVAILSAIFIERRKR